jgi:hypothetical protein
MDVSHAFNDCNQQLEKIIIASHGTHTNFQLHEPHEIQYYTGIFSRKMSSVERYSPVLDSYNPL